MKTYFKLFTNKTVFLAIVMLVFIFACSSDDDGGGNNNGGGDPDPNAPTIGITGETTIIGKAGETFSVDLTLNAPGGNKELVVYFGGGVLEIIPLDNDATSFTYNTQTVPADANEGQNFEYEFLLADNSDQDSDRVAFTVSAAIYDTIEVGGESLYNVTIPDTGIIEEGVTFAADRDYYITKSMTFDAGSSLTIQEGVTVYMKIPVEVVDLPVEIAIKPGADLSIVGTSTNPVVMTPSSSLTGVPEPADWSKLSVGEVGTAFTGGTIQYLRTEYASDGIRLINLDNSNTIEYIQSFWAGDEGIYLTDGNVNAKYLVATNSDDESFRLGDTYTGKLQFGIAVLTEALDDKYALQIQAPSEPIISNFTIVGPGSTVVDEIYGMRFQTGGGAGDGRVYNTIIASFPLRGVRIANKLEVAEDLDGPRVFAYSYVFDIGTQAYRDDRKAADLDPDPVHINPFHGHLDGSDVFQNPFFNNVTGLTYTNDNAEGYPLYTPTLETIAGIGTNDFIPDATPTAKENHDPSTVDPFFTSVTYVGAVENEAGDWTVGWVKNPDGTIR